MTEKPRQVSDLDIQRMGGVEIEMSEGVISDKGEQTENYSSEHHVDDSAPMKKVLCVMTLIDKTLALARKSPLKDNPVFVGWDSIAQKIDSAVSDFFGKLAKGYEPTSEEYMMFFAVIDDLKRELVKFSVENAEKMKIVQEQLLEITCNVRDSNDSELRFVPQQSCHLGKDGREYQRGSFVSVVVDKYSQFNKIPFVLGLKPGWSDYPLAARPSYIEELENIRLQIRVLGEHDRKFLRFDKLHAKIYKDAKAQLEIAKESYERKFGGFERLVRDDSIVTGKALEGELWGKLDRTYSYSTRTIAIRKNSSSGEWEILLLCEKKQGGINGKFPGWNTPGGRNNDTETLGDSLRRETQNEAQTRRVTKVLARVAKIPKKNQQWGGKKRHIEFWYVAEVDPDAGLSKTLVELSEVMADSIRWVPLSEFVIFTYQNSKHPDLDENRVFEQKKMYLNTGLNLSRILLSVANSGIVPGFVLPPNFSEFQRNVKAAADRINQENHCR